MPVESTSASSLLSEGPEGTKTKRVVAPAVEKAVMVLDVLASSRTPLTFAQLAVQVPFPRSSLHNLCTTLVSTGLAERGSDGRYAIGLRVVQLARGRLESMEIVSAFQGVCSDLEAFPDTIVLSVLDGADVVYVSFVSGDRPLAVRYEIGLRLPAALTASGKAILATLPEERVRELIPERIENPFVDGPHKSIARLLHELRETRERGYSIDDEEVAPGMGCIGAPVFAGSSGGAVGAVAICFLKNTPSWDGAANRDRVLHIAAEIDRRMGAVTRP